MAFTGAGLCRSTEVEMGAEELHDIQLLHRCEAFPTGFSSRMQHLLRETQSDALLLSYVLLGYLCIYVAIILKFFHSFVPLMVSTVLAAIFIIKYVLFYDTFFLHLLEFVSW